MRPCKSEKSNYVLANRSLKLHACLGPLLAWALTAVSPALARSELDQDWLQYDLPQRDTLVDVDTNFGLYRLPIGYLSFAGLLKGHEVTADPVSGRHRYSLVALLFHFTMPDGHQNTADDWNLRWNHHGGDDIGIDPRRYLVGITGMERPSNDLANEIVVLGAGVPPNHLEPTLRPELSVKTHDYAYRGWIEIASTHEHVGIEIGCSGVHLAENLPGHCLGRMFFQQQNIDLEFPLNIERLDSVFEVVNVTYKFLQGWKVK